MKIAKVTWKPLRKIGKVKRYNNRGDRGRKLGRFTFYGGWKRLQLMYRGVNQEYPEHDEYDTWTFSFIWGQVYYHTKKRIKYRKPKKGDWSQDREPQWGVYGYSDVRGIADSIWWWWGHNCKVWHMPWMWEHVRTSAMGINRNWYHETTRPYIGLGGEQYDPKSKKHKEFYDEKYWAGKLYTEIIPYTYTSRHGETSQVLATIKVEEREWRWRWFKWLPFKFTSKIRRTIDVHFSEDIGEGKGSWKGGTVGCGYEMKKGESPYMCLRRMEKERKF